MSLTSAVIVLADTKTESTENTSSAQNTVYLKNGGEGDGSSESSPTGSFADAVAAAAAMEDDARIQVIGEIFLNYAGGAYVFPTHSNKITITGYGTQGKISMDTTNGGGSMWFLSGDLQMEYLELNLTPWRWYIITQFNNLYMMDGITMTEGSNKIGVLPTNGSDISDDFDGAKYIVDYDIVLRSGVYDAVAIGAQVGTRGHVDGHARLVLGGTAEIWDLHVARDAWWATVRDVTIILDGGKIYTGMAYHNYDKATMDQHGAYGATGTYKVVVTENFNIVNSFASQVWGDAVWYGISGVSLWKDGAAHITSENLGYYSVEIEEGVYDSVLPYVNTASFDEGAVKRIASRTGFADSSFVPDYEDALTAEDNTVYVKHNGAGDGLTPQTPTGNFIHAMQLAAAMDADATVQVIGEIFWNFAGGAFSSPEHNNKIRITGEGTYGKITADTTNGGGAMWFLSGDTQIDNIELSFKPWRIYIITQLHSFYALDGISMARGSNKIGLIGATSHVSKHFDGMVFKADYEIVLLSGVYDTVAIFSQSSGIKGNLDGEVSFTFGGSAEAWIVCVSYDSFVSVKKVNVCLDGGVIHTMTAFHNKTVADMDGYGYHGALEEYTVTVTDNFNVAASFNQRPWEGALTYGISGTSIWADADQSIANDAFGSYTLRVEEGVYDAVMEKTNASSFDKVTKIASGTGTMPETVYGDINGDGEFNNTDITALVRHLSGWEEYSFAFAVADVDGNGRINNRDAIVMIKALAGFAE